MFFFFKEIAAYEVRSSEWSSDVLSSDLASIRQRSPNMWTLICIGTGAAYFYSLVATALPGLFPESFSMGGGIGVYYEVAAVIISLTLLGQLLELKADRKSVV